MERRKKIAVELSDLVVYCRPVPFNEDSKDHTALFCSSISSLDQPVAAPEIGTDRACYKDMSSFPETKAEKFTTRSKGKRFLQYNRRQLSRVYPRGQRLDSSNYDPLPMWLCGSQLVALNFQTPGECGPGRCRSGGSRLPAAKHQHADEARPVVPERAVLMRLVWPNEACRRQ